MNHPSLCLFVSNSFAGIMFFDKVALDAQARGAICGDGSTPGGKCTWHRAIDFQPNTGAPDEGFAFLKRDDARTMFEYGTAWDYKEVCHLPFVFFSGPFCIALVNSMGLARFHFLRVSDVGPRGRASRRRPSFYDGIRTRIRRDHAHIAFIVIVVRS